MEAPIFAKNPNGKRYELHGITIERIEDGQIADVWMNRDDVSMQQLG